MQLRLSTTAFAAALLLGGVGMFGLNACEPTAPAKRFESTFEVHGMVCESCEKAISAKVSTLDGVHSASASHSEEQVTVLYDPAETTAQTIAAAIETLGYTVVSHTPATPIATPAKP